MPGTRQKYTGATDMQNRTRQERHFDETERALPTFSPLAPAAPSPSDRARYLLSYLGRKNPLPRPITAEDTVWLLDNTAYRNARTGRWEAEFTAAAFSQHASCAVVDAVAGVARLVGLGEDDPDYPTVEERVCPFVRDVKPGARVKVLQAGRTPLKLGPGGRNGISTDVRTLPDDPDGAWAGALVPTFARVPKGADGILEMRTFFAGPEGWGVISDIDDTIKVTQTSDPVGILRTTFLERPEACPGMPELYRAIASAISTGPAAGSGEGGGAAADDDDAGRESPSPPPWFYLSASPYNLYPFLREFREQHFPHGTIILREASWTSLPGLLTTLTVGTEDYKVAAMNKIRRWLPRRKMICVGDSTQSDPEAYGEIYRAHPGWVRLILIRKVEDIAALGIAAKNEPERFEKAFHDIPRGVWHVFTDPAECESIVRDAVAGVTGVAGVPGVAV
ncbi:hypothetical protein GGS23DRAFT_114612 [Durotheca rogersii]|uniref:uncharacterized protein n=1 Tax=Durotheca rogersii TaxID=419775 RepID=UPI002221109C|nr:uncharacterized protein GGS23DRAFT_114612 [Durotheca rogersii]KAI5862246.1 hypothetical protein GGS23DRAFT_114612 [Durotheca rogersii]